MTNLNLTAGQAGLLAVGLAALGVAATLGGRSRPRAALVGAVLRRAADAASYAFEAAVIAALYAAWQWLAGFGHSRLGVAVDRGDAVLRLERSLHLPSELSVQRVLLPHRLLVEAANLYYATAHFTVMGIVLIWLFVRHRDGYPPVRTTLVVVTAACLAIQFVAVAPPRLLPGAGFVDTAARYGQSVYAPLDSAEVRTLLGVDFGADQLSAMPSVHVAWALLVAVAVTRVGRSRGRMLIWIHPALTIVVIVATANHFWLDGVVAAGLLVGALAVARFVHGPGWERRIGPLQSALAHAAGSRRSPSAKEPPAASAPAAATVPPTG